MPRANVYINNENYQNFQREDNKSGLVNELLSRHFRRVHLTTKESQAKLTDVQLEEKKIAVTLNTEKTTTAKLFERGANLCKIHSLPLTASGKCLQKGCKYS